MCWYVICTIRFFAVQLVAHVQRTRRDLASQDEKYQTRQIFSSLPCKAETARKIQRTREAAAELPSRSPVSSAAASRVRRPLPLAYKTFSSSSPLLMTTSISDDFVIPLVTIEVNYIVDLTRKARGCLLLPSCMVYSVYC